MVESLLLGENSKPHSVRGSNVNHMTESCDSPDHGQCLQAGPQLENIIKTVHHQPAHGYYRQPQASALAYGNI